MNVLDFIEYKKQNKKITMITCYDYTSACIASASNVDTLLIGDSAAMTMHGYDSTLPIDVQTMAQHVRSVKAGAANKFIIGDMPFLSYRKSLSENMNHVEALMQAGAHAIKLEGVHGNEELIQHIVESGVPVMGHIGLTPQSVHQLGGFKVQGRGEKAGESLIKQANKLEELGCFGIVLEAVPSTLAEKITQNLVIPTIGIGAGVNTDGQVLVMQDLLGLNTRFKPKFVRTFLNGHDLFLQAFNEFDSAVKNKTFPNVNESYE